MRKVFLENLPKDIYGDDERINWKGSVGYKVRFIYDDIEGWVEIVGYKRENQCLYIKYEDKDGFRINKDSFKICQLSNLLGKHTGEFKIEIGTIFKDEKRDISIIDREYRLRYDKKYNKKWYKYKCNKCGYEGWMVESSLLDENGCACCCPTHRTVVQGINDIPTTAPWMIKFFQGGYDEAKLYTKASHKKIYPICPDCGRIKDKEMKISTIYNNKTISCSCGDGIRYPNKFMFGVLEQLGIDFITEYSPEWIGRKLYDFYFELNDKKYIVEMDGGFHKQDNNMNGQTKEESKEIDDHKDKIAKEHGVEKVIRIDCDKSELDFIKKKILESKLNDLFNLNIDWIKVEEFALSNRVKEACILKRDNSDLTTTEIAEIMNMNYSTITKYLKKGSKIWDWINYDPKEEKSKAHNKLSKMKRKQVEIFKDNVSLGVFPSCIELERQSEKLFGVKLYVGNISAVCRGILPHYKNFTFSFI